MRKTVLILLLVLVSGTAFASEGKWTPAQVLEIDPAWLKSQGLEVPPSRLWDARTGTGLLSAAVKVGGCSAGFISPDGLLITNHHCLFSLLQQHSTPENDIITHGFVARDRNAELPGQSIRVAVPQRFVDVTKEVLAAVPHGASDLERARSIDHERSDLVASCEKQPSHRCNVAVFEGGLQYVLVDTVEYPDVRLVYAPPRAIGEYGGETDNWMWPRHTGDFSIARVYTAPDGAAAPYGANNIPYHPAFHFPIAKGDLSPRDFVMVLGYPGVTYRSLVAAEMAQKRNLYFPRRVEVYGEWIRALEESTKESAEGRIAVADTLKSLLNRYKNAQGQIAGLDRGDIVAKQKAQDERVLRWITNHPKYAGAARAHADLEKLEAEQRSSWERDFLLEQLPIGESVDRSFSGPKLLSAGTLIARAAAAQQKPDDERPEAFRDRNLARLRERLKREEKSFYAPADRAVLASWIRRALALPEGQKIESVEKAFSGLTPQQLDAKIGLLMDETTLDEPETRQAMFGETRAQLRARKDPLLDLSIGVAEALDRLDEKKEGWEGTISRLRPQWRRAVIAEAGKPVAPDANSTLRVSFAHVEGYEPRDAVFYQPQTTLSGVVEKNTGEEPFNAPELLLKAAAARDLGAFADPDLKDVPIDFLADADTTGGNSGSPVVNGRGELVGVNFDRVWENVANDFGFNPDIARNVSVDVRYLLWLLERTPGAQSLMEEIRGGTE
ncbi:MAG: S46 family peptidase [Thermoanaerobaculia bacterium]